MDKETVTIFFKADSGAAVGDHYEDERRFEVSVPSRAEVSELFDKFTDMTNQHDEWEQ